MREIGIVTWYDSCGGSGYIARKKGEDVYVHQSAVRSGTVGCYLREGVAVEFTLIEDSEGSRAHDVVLIR